MMVLLQVPVLLLALYEAQFYCRLLCFSSGERATTGAV